MVIKVTMPDDCLTIEQWNNVHQFLENFTSEWRDEGMSNLNKKKIVNALNSLEVIESSGGDCAYVLVENSKENHEKLNEVGISSETINKYGDEETFCILSLGFSEGLIDLYDGSKCVLFDEEIKVPIDNGKEIVLFKTDNKYMLSIWEDSGDVHTKELSEEQINEIKDFLS